MIELVNISKSYGDNFLFKGSNFTFKKNKINIIVGESGSGKTSILEIILGLTSYEGKVLGLDKMKKSAVFQEDLLFENLSGYSNLDLVLDYDYSKDICREDFNKINMLGKEDILVSKYSGGMKRRVSILRALLVNFDLLVLDEPFKGLDEKNYRIMRNLVLEYSKDKTVIISTHMEKDMNLLTGNLIEL